MMLIRFDYMLMGSTKHAEITDFEVTLYRFLTLVSRPHFIHVSGIVASLVAQPPQNSTVNPPCVCDKDRCHEKCVHKPP